MNHSNKKKKSRRGGSCKVRCKDGCKKSAVKTAVRRLRLMFLRLGSPLWRARTSTNEARGCRSSEVYFFSSVLQKGGTVAYIIQYSNKPLYTSINRITVRFNQDDMKYNAAQYNFPYTSPKFLGGRRDTKKLQKHAAMRNKQVGPELTRHGISTALARN